MIKTMSAILLLALAGCSAAPASYNDTACSREPGSYACQIERWQKTDARSAGANTM
jgi:hypothetical protein